MTTDQGALVHPLILLGLVMTVLTVVFIVIAANEVIGAFTESEQEKFDRRFAEIVQRLED